MLFPKFACFILLSAKVQHFSLVIFSRKASAPASSALLADRALKLI